MRVIELFAGIGAYSTALRRIGCNIQIVDVVEIDKFAIKSFNAIHNTNFETQDICTWDKYFDDIDLITHGSPCQDFSVAGKQAGGNIGSGTRSSLMYETIRIVKKLKPKYVIWENVKNILSKRHIHNFNNYLNRMNEAGYNNYYQVLNSKDYGVPQNRERVFTISIRKDIDNGRFEFPETEELKVRLKDILESEVDEKYYLKEEQIKNFIKNNSEKVHTADGECPKIDMLGVLDIKGNECIRRVYSKNGISPTLTNMQGGNRQPKILETPYIVASRGRNPDNPSSRVSGEHLEQRLEPNTKGITNCISTVQKDNYVIDKDVKIRKLTPRECWRLMGFDDVDFEKAAQVNSNTQLYKQAGNSIVVNVLAKIFLNLIKEVENETNPQC